MEDNVKIGGFGEAVQRAVLDLKKNVEVKIFAYDDCFIPQGTVAQLQAEYGLNVENVKNYILSVLQ